MAIQLITDLKGKRCLDALVREYWLMSNCRGEAAGIYFQIEPGEWAEIMPNEHEVCWSLTGTKTERPRDEFAIDGAHYRIRDVGTDYKLRGLRIDGIGQKKVGNRIELCIEFSNATDLTLRYDLITHESSLYLIND